MNSSVMKADNDSESINSTDSLWSLSSNLKGLTVKSDGVPPPPPLIVEGEDGGNLNAKRRPIKKMKRKDEPNSGSPPLSKDVKLTQKRHIRIASRVLTCSRTLASWRRLREDDRPVRAVPCALAAQTRGGVDSRDERRTLASEVLRMSRALHESLTDVV